MSTVCLCVYVIITLLIKQLLQFYFVYLEEKGVVS